MIQVVLYSVMTFLRHLSSFAIPFNKVFAKILCVLIFIFPTILTAQNCTVNANVDVSYCANQPIQLSGAVASAVNGYTPTTTWTQVGGPSVVISNPNILNPSILGTTPSQVYIFRLTGLCQDEELIFDEVRITVNPISIANAGADATYCPGVYTISGNTPANAGETVVWQIVGANNAGVSLSSGSVVSPSITLSQTSAGTSTLRYIITSSNGCQTTDDVIITNLGGVPTVNAGADQNIAANVACYSVSTCTTLNGTFEGNGTGGQTTTWSQVSGPTIATFSNANIRNPQVCNLREGTYVFRLTASGACTNGSDEVTIVVPAPSQSITQVGAMADITFCDGRTSVVLNGPSPSFVGETVLWTVVNNGGGSPVIVSPTSPTTTVTGLVSNAYHQFRYTITNAATGCSTNNTVQIYNQTPPSISVGADQVLACNVTSASVAYTQSGGLYTQYQIISGPTAVMASPVNSSGSPQTITGLTVAGDYVVRFIRNSSQGSDCQTVTDDIKINISISPTASNSGTDQVLACGISNTNLAGNIPATGVGRWSQVSGPSVATFSNITSNTSNVANLLTGDYVLRWTIENGPSCAKNTDDVLVVVRVPPVAMAGADQAPVCLGTSVQLNANVPLRRQQGTWAVVGQVPAGTAPTFTNINDPNAKLQNLIINTVYQLQWTVVSLPQTGGGSCSTSSDIVQITSGTEQGPGDANAGVDICASIGSTSVTLGATAPTAPNTGIWTNVSRPSGSAVPSFSPNASQANAQATGLQAGTYKFVWTITDGICTSNDTIRVTINSALPVASAGSTQTLCGTTATLAGNNPGVGVGTWTQVSGPSLANIVDVNLPTTTINSLVAGDYVFRWTITNGSCNNGTQADVTIRVSFSTSVANIAASSLQVCPPNSTVNINADAINADSQGYWSIVGNAPSSVGFSSSTSPSITVSGLVQGNYKFRWTVSGGVNCPVTFDEVDVYVQEASNAGADQSVCLSNSVTLVGNGPSGTWIKLLGPGFQTITPTSSPSNAAVVTGLTTGTYIFNYTIDRNLNASGCIIPTFDQVTVTVSAAGSTPSAGVNKQFCEGSAINLNGSGDVIPNPVPVGQSGQWAILSQPTGTSNATLSNATAPNATLNIGSNSKYGLYLLKWTITNGTCVIGDEVRIENFQTPTVANAGVDKTVCPPTVKMTANVPTVGQGMWTLVSKTPGTLPTPTILNPQVATTDITGIDASGVYVFRWTISNGPCTPSFDEVTINVPDPAPTTANAGIDQTICNGTAANITGNTPTVGTGAWSKTTDSPYSVFSPAAGTSPATTALSLSAGTYKYIWTITSGACISRDTMIIRNLAVPSAANAGTDQIVCQFSPVNLSAATPTAGTGTWTQIAKPSGNPNVTFLSPNSPTSQVVGTDLGQYTFRWTVSTGVNSPNDCQTSFDEIIVNIVASPTPAIAGISQTICEGQTLTMAGNTPTVGTGTWTKVAGPVGSPEVITNVNSPATTVTGLLAGTYTYRWTIGASGNCTSYDEMTVVVRPKPTLSSATPSCVGGAGTGVITVIGATNPTGGSLDYALGAGGFQSSNIFSNLTNGAYTITIKDRTTNCTNTTTTNISCTDNPVLGLAKSVGSPVLVTNGVYDVPYTVTVKNLGNVALANVQVTDNLNTTFPSPITYSITVKSTSSPFTINSSFDGNNAQNLLNSASSTLAIGATRTITFTVRVSLNGSAQTLFNNTASAGATNSGGTISAISDISNNGGSTAIDPNGNNNPRDLGEDTPTPVSIVNGNIGVAKSVGTPLKISDGVYDVPYTVTVKNIGNVNLTGVQVADDLSATFPSPATYTISQSPQTLAPLAPESSFTGSGANNLLLVNGANTSTLTAGQSRTITFTVRVTLNGSTQTIFNNQVTATGINPSAQTVSDLSNNGVETAIDPNSNGYGGDSGENTPTPVTISNPIIGVAKSTVGSPSLQGDGSYNVTYQVITKNVGNVTLNNVQVTENLATTFVSPITYTVVSKSGASDINTGFLGTPSAQNLLTGSGTLAPNTSNTYLFTVNIKLNGYTGNNIFLNSVTATGTGTTGGSSSDVSNNGTDPTPTGNTPTPVTIQNQADLSLTKTVSKITGTPADPNVGENIIYTITVTNAGPNTATNVEVKDVLPAGLQFVSSANLTNVAGTLTAVIPNIAVNASASVTFVAKVLSSGLITNAAEVSLADQPDIDSPHGNGTANAEDDRSSVDINAQQADLSLTKTVSNANPNVGSNITYTITVSNAGPSTATNIQVKDILPAGLSFVSSVNFTNTSGTLLSTNIATIPVNGSVALTFVATVTQAGSILNKAEVSMSDQYDPDSQPNTGTEDGQDDTGGVLIGGQQADLSLQKSVSNTNPNVGDVVTYTITVANAGPSTATNVTIQDILPTGLQFVSSGTLTNTLGTLTNTSPMTVLVGTPINLTFNARVLTPAVNTALIINNRAEVKTVNQFDPDSQPNTGTADGQDDTDDAPLTIQTADLSLVKSTSQLSVNVGDNITYTITVSNAGANTATNVEVKDILPTGLLFISSSDFTAAGQTLTASGLTIASGTSKILTYIARVTQAGSLKNEAQVTKSDQYDIDSQPDTGTTDGQDDTGNITIAGQLADLSLIKTVSNSEVNPNEIVTFTITVSNAGPNAVTTGSVSDALPVGLTFVSSSTLTNNNGILVGNFSNLQANTSIVFTFQAKVTGTGIITNKAQIASSDVPDSDSTPNNGTDNGEDDTENESIRVRQADLELTKTVSKTNPNVGENITYTITVLNKGTDNATNVKVKDVLPVGLTFVSSSDFVNTSGLLISNNIASITAGGQRVLTFVATVTQAGSILNKAEVLTSDQFDPDSQPNTGTEDGQDDTGGVLIGGQQADLSLTKVVSKTNPNVGENITYTITVNNAGPSVATNVAVRDVLPAGINFVSSSDFTNSSGTLTANIASIPVGTPKVLTFVGVVQTATTIVNSAEISSADQYDPDSQPNTGTTDGQDDAGSATIIPKQSDLSLTKTVSNTAPNVNANITYTINVTNAGPDIATNVEVKDILPAGLQFVSSADLTNTAGTLSGTVNTIAIGATKSFSFVAKVLNSNAILNKAEVSKSDEFDPDSQPNTGTEDGQDDTGGVLIGGQQSDLSLAKVVSNTTPNVGDNITYTITVTNVGPSTATNIEVKDILPVGLQFVSSTDFINLNGTLTSQIASLPVGTKTLTFVARVSQPVSITNKVEVSKSDQFDPDSQPNTGTEDGQDDTDDAILTPKTADLSLTKTVSKTNPNVGENITYTVTVNNDGTDAATNVQVKDVLPTGLQFVSSTDFINTSGVLFSNNIPTISSGGIVTLTFVAKVTQAGAILNKAEVSKSDVYDIDSQVNTGTEDGQDDTGGVLIGGQQSDLSLTKSVSTTTGTPAAGTPASPNVGEIITYTITVNNAGPSIATGVEVKDVLPFGLSFVGSTDFTNNAGILTVSNLTIAVGTPKTLTFTAQVTQSTTIINKAEISTSDQFDPDSQPNTGTADGQDDTGYATIIPQVADLSLVKLATPLSANVGDNITYTIEISNAGPSTATNVEVKDVLPVGLNLVNAGNFTNNAGTLTATIPSLAAGVTQSLTFTAQITQAGNIINAAQITKSDQFDTDSQVNNGTTNNEDDTDEITVGGILADLSLTKTVDKAIVNPNENVEFTITITNAGPSAVTSASVRDVLPAGLQFVSSSTFANTNGTLIGQVSNLGVGQSQTLKFVAQVTGTGKITNNTEIASSNVPDPDSSPNNGILNGEDDTDSTSVQVRIADLSLQKFVNNANANVGDEVEFTLLVNNAGANIATNVQVKDVLPAGLQFTSSTDFTNTSGVLLSNNILTIPVNGSVTLKFKAIITTSGGITNKAEITKSDQFDPDSQVNTGIVDGQDDVGAIYLNAQLSDLSLTKTVSNSTPNVGDNITYTITINNAGTSTATNVEVKDILPAGIVFVSSSDFTNVNGTLTSTLPLTVTVGNPQTLTFVAQVSQSASITNKAEISKSDQFDIDSQPNTGTTDGQDDIGSVTITPQITDLSLTKTVSNTNPSVNTDVTYTISVTNEGPNVATNVEVKDVLPAGLQFISSSDLINNAGTLTGTIANIPLGATRSLSFVAKVTQSGSILNRAEVSKSDQFDSDSQPNTGTLDGQDDTGGVLIGGQQSDLSLTKTVNNPTPNVGENVIYT
ncbi:hypothetical protein VB796_18065, partial [Arcicella sp. LKC2W]|uniref:DUF7507 domain-containing protein n=1 Tax=Arcicella sp. LKC2W TaxID=2984198 RepID=UPI002B21DB84